MKRIARIITALALALGLHASALATGTASGFATIAEHGILTSWGPRYAGGTATAGGSTTSIVLTSSVSSNYAVGDWVTCGSYVSQVTAIPDGTHLTVSTMAGSCTAGAVTIVAWSPVTLYVGLLTTCPTDAGGTGAVEVSTAGTAYSRTAVAPTTSNWGTPTGTPRSFSNSGTITIGATATANWGTALCVGLYDAATAGNLLSWGTLSSSVTVNSGNPAPYFAAAALTLLLD